MEKIKIWDGNIEISERGKRIDELMGISSLINPDKLGEICDKKPYCYNSIPDLKNKIKHSKNPMEKKMLEKQLNELYKERKKR